MQRVGADQVLGVLGDFPLGVRGSSSGLMGVSRMS